MTDRSAVRILRLIEYVYKDPEFAAADELRWLRGMSNANVIVRSSSLPWEMVEWQEPDPIVLHPPELDIRFSGHDGHTLDCHIRKRPTEDYAMGNPDSEQHCSSCHCSCDPDGPSCNHTAGCPGC